MEREYKQTLVASNTNNQEVQKRYKQELTRYQKQIEKTKRKVESARK